jgi:hypothetical protein
MGEIIRIPSYRLIIQEKGPTQGTLVKSRFGKMEWQWSQNSRRPNSRSDLDRRYGDPSGPILAVRFTT